MIALESYWLLQHPYSDLLLAFGCQKHLYYKRYVGNASVRISAVHAIRDVQSRKFNSRAPNTV